MVKTLGRALLIGTVILAVADATWLLIALVAPASELLAFAVWTALPVAAFVSALTAPRHKVLAGIALAIPASVLFAVTNAAFDIIGNGAGLSGLGGAVTVVAKSLPFAAWFCAVGAVLGYAWSRFVSRA